MLQLQSTQSTFIVTPGSTLVLEETVLHRKNTRWVVFEAAHLYDVSGHFKDRKPLAAVRYTAAKGLQWTC